MLKRLVIHLSILSLWACGSMTKEVSSTSNLQLHLLSEVDDDKRVDLLRKVKTWYHVQVGADIKVVCNVGVVIATNSSEDDLHVDHEVHWSYVKDRGLRFESESLLPNDTTKGIKVSSNSRCRFTRHYESPLVNVDNQWLKQADIKCLAELQIPFVQFNHSGYYICKSRLSVRKSTDPMLDAYFEEEVLMKVRQQELTTFIVTTIVLSVIGLFVLIIGIFKLSGRQFPWENPAVNRDRYPISRLDSVEYEFNRDHHKWFPRHRSNSSVSNMSGIVFQADPESMAKLMERLQKVDSTSTDTSTPSSSSDKVSTMSEAASKTAEAKTTPTTVTSHSSKSPVPRARTSKSAKDLFNYFERKNQAGSFKKAKKDSRPLSRHSSLGILPSSISIGSGCFVEDPYEEILRKETALNHRFSSGPGRHLHDDSRKGHAHPPFHPRTPLRGFRDVSLGSSRSRLNSENDTILEEPRLVEEIVEETKPTP